MKFRQTPCGEEKFVGEIWRDNWWCYYWYVFDETDDVQYPYVDIWKIRNTKGQVYSHETYISGFTISRKRAKQKVQQAIGELQEMQNSKLTGKINSKYGKWRPVAVITEEDVQVAQIKKLADAARRGKDLSEVDL